MNKQKKTQGYHNLFKISLQIYFLHDMISIKIIFTFFPVTCLQCYSCQAKDDTRCNDPLTPDNMNQIGGMGDCGDGYTHCIKFKTLQYLADSGYITGKSRGKWSYRHLLE